MVEYKFIKVEQTGYIGKVILARPAKRNAFTPTMVNEIHHAFQYFNSNDAIKVVCIEAEGPVFCAGMDLKTFENPLLDEPNPNITNLNISLGEVFEGLMKPSIALVNGNVIAGGFLIILGCTYVYCDKDVQFRLPELELGIFPFQVMASLLKVMPEKKVLQLCLETGYFNSDKALAMGIMDGYLEQNVINAVIGSFENKSSKAMQAGIKALREIQDVKQEDRFSYLKAILDGLNKD